MTTRFFILGCQRSGTTLMRLVLECHSRIECLDEAFAYAALGATWRPRPRHPLLGLKVPCLTEQFTAPTWWDPLLLAQVRNDYDGERLVFMVRDVRDTVTSMAALRVRGGPWFDTYLEPTLRAKCDRDQAYVERYGEHLAAAARSEWPTLARAAVYWRSKVESLFDYLASGFPVLLVRYEDLVMRPRVELLRVCGFLQVPWEAALLSHERFGHREVDRHGIAIGGTNTARPIDTDSISRWERGLSDAQARAVLQAAGPVQAELYPECVPAAQLSSSSYPPANVTAAVSE